MMLKKLFLTIVIIIVLLGISFSLLKPFYSVPILKYHSVNTAEYNKDTSKVSPELFEKQMEFIQRRGYQVISLDEYLESLKSHKKIRNAVVITFDDGYADNYFYAFSALKKYHFPAAIFLITKHIGQNKSFLNYEQIKEMEKGGITFDSHTINHIYLPSIKNEEQLRKEIFGSKEILENNLNHRIDYLTYPIGGYNEHIVELVKEAGYAAAFTTNRGKGKFNQNIYALKRIKITENDSILSLWFKLSGYFHLFKKFKSPD